MENSEWQLHRSMSAIQFKRAAKVLKLNMAATGRYIGVSPRTLRRMVKGQAKVPTAAALLLRSLIAHGEKPVVPDWRRP